MSNISVNTLNFWQFILEADEKQVIFFADAGPLPKMQNFTMYIIYIYNWGSHIPQKYDIVDAKCEPCQKN